MEKTKSTDKLLTHMIDRLTDNEIATSDIKQMLIKLNATIQEVVEVLDLVVAEDAEVFEQQVTHHKSLQGNSSVTKYVISEYFRENPDEAKELLDELTEQKVLFIHDIGES